MGCLGKEPLLHGTGTFAQDSSTAADWVAIIMWYYSHLFNSVLSTNLERSIVISLDVGWFVRLRVWTPSADLSPRIGLKPIAQIDKCHLTNGGLMWIFQTLCRSSFNWRAFISGFPIGYWHFLNKKNYRICNQRVPEEGLKSEFSMKVARTIIPSNLGSPFYEVSSQKKNSRMTPPLTENLKNLLAELN